MPVAFAHIPPQHLDDIANCWVLTPNERLAREFSTAFDLAQAESGAVAWPSLTCMSLGRFWLKQFLWLQDMGLAAQKLIPQNDINLRFQQNAPANYAQQTRVAVSAWQQTRAYDIDLRSPQMANERSGYFVQWCQHAMPESVDEAVVEADLPRLLVPFAQEIAAAAQQRFLLIDIEHLTPAESEFFQRLQRADHGDVNLLQAGHWHSGFDRDLGLMSQTGAAHEALPTVTMHGFDSLGEELMAAADWAKEQQRKNPEASIGVVVPDLSGNYDRVLRQFSATLSPHSDSRSPTFDLSGGKSLASQPVWQHARIFLQWLTQPADQSTLAPLLHSPFLALPWCQDLQQQWPSWATRKLGISALLTDESYHSLRERIAKLPNKARLDVWIRQVNELLDCVAWPRTQELGSIQFQAAQRIREVLSELTANPDPALISFANAMELMDWALDQTFAPQRQASNIQILGLLETTGLSFDHLWVCGMSAEQFPGKATLPSFIPRQVAVTHGLPRCTQDQELAFAQRTLASWVSRAGQLQMSYTWILNGAEVKPTPLIAPDELGSQPSNREVTPLNRRHPLMNPSGVPLQTEDDCFGSPMPPGPVPGGSQLLELQAQCAFSAHAIFRLGLGQDMEPRDFLNPMERGITLHRVLERLYQQFPDPEIAWQQSESVLPDLCTEALSRYSHLPQSFVAAELTRLQQLIAEFLALERQREHFQVLETERRYVLELGSLSFTLRIDRLDQIDDQIIVIDYKTGRVSISGAQHDLVSPQLPCYSLIRDDIAGVYYAQLREDDCKLVGLAEDDQQLTQTKQRKIKTTATDIPWQQQRDHWQRQLDGLASDIAAGNAEVNPLPQACRYCHLSPLCRVDEKSQASDPLRGQP